LKALAFLLAYTLGTTGYLRGSFAARYFSFLLVDAVYVSSLTGTLSFLLSSGVEFTLNSFG
jgi:hypothetical protein